MDHDTFLTAVYTVVDDLYHAHFAARKPRRRGHQPEVSDSEILTLQLLAHWYGRSEAALLRYAQRHWRAYFPRLLSQSAFNRRSRDLAGLLTQLVAVLAALDAPADPAYVALDSVPVPLARRCRGDQHKLFADEASIGLGGSDKEWYYGCRLLLSVSNTARIQGFTLGPANTDDRWLAEAQLCWQRDPAGQPWEPADFPPSHKERGGRQGPTGPVWPRDGAGQPLGVPVLADNGFRGRVWSGHWQQDYGACVITPACFTGEQARAARHQHSSWRQVVETTNNAVEHAFHLWFPGAKTFWGLRTRIAAKLAAFNLGVALNDRFGRPRFALATLFC
jgi:hypothetical protein